MLGSRGKILIGNAGEIVEHAIRRQNISISELSRQMNVTRRTLYNWFGQRTLNPEVIFAIGEVIQYDFSVDFDEEFNPTLFKRMENNSDLKIKKDPASDNVHYWMEKYISLLEDYKGLLQATELPDSKVQEIK